MVCAAVPAERAGLAIAAMRHGEDVLMDKPGVTTMADLERLQQVVAEAGRIVLRTVALAERRPA